MRIMRWLVRLREMRALRADIRFAEEHGCSLEAVAKLHEMFKMMETPEGERELWRQAHENARRIGAPRLPGDE